MALLIHGLTLLGLLELDFLNIGIADEVGELYKQETALHRRLDVDGHILPLRRKWDINTWTGAPVTKTPTNFTSLRTLDGDGHLVGLILGKKDFLHGHKLHLILQALCAGHLKAVGGIVFESIAIL